MKPILLSVVFMALLFNACASKGAPYLVSQPDPHFTGTPGVFFKAGAAEVDITPAPGYPLFGYSRPDVLTSFHAEGYWTRLKAKAVVFEDRAGHRLGIVQADLGAIGDLLYRKITEQSAAMGFQPGNLLVTAAHTHAGPGGIFGHSFYNEFGSTDAKFFPELVDWLVLRICDCLQQACAAMAPARIAHDSLMLEGLSRNRSIEAWINNFAADGKEPPYYGVIPRVHLLRVDRVDLLANTTTPLAALLVLPAHATTIDSANKLYHGDLPGAVSRLFSEHIRSRYRLDRPFITAVTLGPEGDVSPNYLLHGKQECLRLGKLVSDCCLGMFLGLDGRLEEVSLQYGYREIRLPGAEADGGNRLCKGAMIGLPVLAGAEDGRSAFHGKFGIVEGAGVEAQGCQGTKMKPLGDFAHLLLGKWKFPDTAAIQIIRFGDMFSMACVPGEPTTETGRRIGKTLEAKSGNGSIAVIAVANGYISYIATQEEYQAQHFEGAFTLYGPLQAKFMENRLGMLWDEMGSDKYPCAYAKERVFYPGARGKSPAGRAGKFKRKTHMQMGLGKIFANGRLDRVNCIWYDFSCPKFNCISAEISVECDGDTLIGPDGAPENDNWLNFEVKQLGEGCWSTTWFPPPGLDAGKKYHIKVVVPDQEPLYSDEFSLAEESGENGERLAPGHNPKEE